ncbi:MAG TPA: cytochrome d ubiquinol oxidase subunit II [Flavobacteriaceae bacterium]|nr:cytochrome d ubiquinol oxidase subunit II [Flavobacteriaceae bacterium]
MEVFWFIVLMLMLSVYIILDGYDFGAGIIHLFFAKKEEDKVAITKSIGPFWDANEVWLIASGGVLFFAFPTLYASSFSGFYLPLIMILWLLIFRAIGLELRGEVNNKLWKKVWDKAFGLASLLLALFFGLALGNVVRGVNLGAVENGVSTHEAIYFFVPLWNAEFSPFSEALGIIDWFTILLGIIAVVALTIHGANWIILKTNSSINNKLKDVIFKLSVALSLLVIVSIIVWGYVSEHPLDNFNNYPFLYIFPLIGVFGLFNLFRVKKLKQESSGFLYSSMFLFGAFATTASALFPVVLPSTNNINPSLTVYNTAAGSYGLNVGIYWWVIAIILVAIYLFIQYKMFSGKMDDVPYGHH